MLRRDILIGSNPAEQIINFFDSHDRHDHALSRFVVGKVVDDGFVGKQSAGERHIDFDPFSVEHSSL